MKNSLCEDHLGWPPEGEVFAVKGIDLRVLDGEHPFHRTNAAAAASNWLRESSENPALFDGEVILQERLSIKDGMIAGEGFLTPFSTFLWWRKQPPRPCGYQIFGLPVPVSCDGAIIAIRMAAHTANAGQVYCPAGSLDRDDIVDGRCDIFGNMAREASEETGLDLGDAQAEAQAYAFHVGQRVAVFQVFRFALTADAMLERIARHMLREEEPEIDGAVAIRSADPSAHRYNVAMPPMLDWFFDQST